MAESMFVPLLDAIVLALNTDRPADVPVVTKRRRFPGEKVTTPLMGVFLGDEALDPPRGSSNTDPIARRRLTIAVQCCGVVDDLDELDASVSPLLHWATSVLAPLKPVVGVHYLRETGTTRVTEYMDVAVLIATQVYECSYQTLRSNQSLSS